MKAKTKSYNESGAQKVLERKTKIVTPASL